MIRCSRTLFAACLLLLPALPVRAQDWAGHGRLQGEVTDQEGKPVVGAKVSLHAPDHPTMGPSPLTTDKHGRWSILGLKTGTWGVTIEAEGYNTSEGTVAVNEFGIVPPLKIKLNPASAAAPAAGGGNKAQDLLDGGDALLAASQFAAARAKYQEVYPTLTKPEFQVFTLRRIAETYRGEENYDKAAEALQQALTLTPNDVKTTDQLARLYAFAKQYDKAEATAQQLLTAAPGDTEALKLLAGVYYEEKKKTQAIDTLKQVVQLKPDDAPATKLLAEYLLDSGREAEAKEYMAKLPQDVKVDPNSLLNVGIRQYNEALKPYSEKKMRTALATFDAVVQQNPALPEAYHYRAQAEMSLNKMAEAKADFKKLLELDPNGKYAKDAKEMLKYM